jgi:hypothetical protein
MVEAQYLIRSENQARQSASRASNPPQVPLHLLSDPRVTPRLFECARMTPDDASSMTWAPPMMRFAASFNQGRYAACVSYLEETYGGAVGGGSIPVEEQVRCRPTWLRVQWLGFGVSGLGSERRVDPRPRAGAFSAVTCASPILFNGFWV